jgi:DNA-directed RNA polymerase subunit M/transcription elongation factor TFIIS
MMKPTEIEEKAKCRMCETEYTWFIPIAKEDVHANDRVEATGITTKSSQAPIVELHVLAECPVCGILNRFDHSYDRTNVYVESS